MFKLILKLIQRYECVIIYQGPVDWDSSDWSTKLHIQISFWLALGTSLLGFIHPWFLTLYVLAFLLMSPLMELCFQYHKEKDKPLHNVMAQMIERGFAFLLLLPIPIGILYPFLLEWLQ